MPNNLPARRSSLLGTLSPDRATGKELSAIQTGAFLERALDEALRNLVVAKLGDIGLATHHALEEGDEIVHDLARRIQNDAFGAQALAGLGEEGIRALRHQLRRLTEGASNGLARSDPRYDRRRPRPGGGGRSPASWSSS